MPSVGIYTRISRDSEGQGKGVARQRQDCEALCRAEGWDVVEVYEDNDVSAFSGKPRPGFLRMLHDLKTGRIDTVVAWHNDRLHRSTRELLEFIDIVKDVDGDVRTVQGGDFDLSTANGRMMVSIAGILASAESEHRSERIQRKHLELAHEGKRSGGGRRAFGYARDNGVEILVPEEAALIRKAAAQTLAGASLRSVVRMFNDAGMPTVTGAPWSPTTVKRILMSGRISGQREHRGEIVATAEWPAIIRPDETERLRRILSNPSRHRRAPGDARRYLLSGFVYCECGGRMTTRKTPRGKPRYLCVVDRGGCNACGIAAPQLEAHVVDATWIALLSPGFTTAVAEIGAEAEDPLLQLKAEMERINADKEQAFEDRASNALRNADFLRLIDAYGTRLDEIEDEMRAIELTQSPLTQLSEKGTELRQEWDELDLSLKRSFLSEIIERVTISKVTRQTNYFAPDRIHIDWRI